MVIFSEFHPSAYSGTIDINVICQFCNKPHILPGFTLIPHKSNVIKMDIMDTYFFCRCLIPPDHGDRDISVQHLDIIKIDIINLSFGKLFRISAKQDLNIEQFLFCLLYSDIFIMYIMSQAEFIRQAITGAAIRPIITVSPVNDELLAAVGKLTAEYGRIGGNLNQIARTLNEWHSPYPQLAGEVRAAVSDLAALKFEVLQKVGDAVGNIQTYQL